MQQQSCPTPGCSIHSLVFRDRKIISGAGRKRPAVIDGIILPPSGLVCQCSMFTHTCIKNVFVFFLFSVTCSKESRMNGQYQQTVDVLNNDNKWVPWEWCTTRKWFINTVSLLYCSTVITGEISTLVQQHTLMTRGIRLWLPQIKSVWSLLKAA